MYHACVRPFLQPLYEIPDMNELLTLLTAAGEKGLRQVTPTAATFASSALGGATQLYMLASTIAASLVLGHSCSHKQVRFAQYDLRQGLTQRSYLSCRTTWTTRTRALWRTSPSCRTKSASTLCTTTTRAPMCCMHGAPPPLFSRPLVPRSSLNAGSLQVCGSLYFVLRVVAQRRAFSESDSQATSVVRAFHHFTRLLCLKQVHTRFGKCRPNIEAQDRGCLVICASGAGSHQRCAPRTKVYARHWAAQGHSPGCGGGILGGAGGGVAQAGHPLRPRRLHARTAEGRHRTCPGACSLWTTLPRFEDGYTDAPVECILISPLCEFPFLPECYTRTASQQECLLVSRIDSLCRLSCDISHLQASSVLCAEAPCRLACRPASGSSGSGSKRSSDARLDCVACLLPSIPFALMGSISFRHLAITAHLII